MDVSQAFTRLNEIVEGVIPSFGNYSLFLHVENFCNNASLNPTTLEKAKYLVATLVISTRDADDDEPGIEHRIGISVEVKKHSVDEDDMETARSEFEERVEELLAALSETADTESVIKRFDEKAEAEYLEFVRELEESKKKTLPLRIIGYALFIVGAVILFAVATLS